MNTIINDFLEQQKVKEIIKGIKEKLSPIIISGLNDVVKNIIIQAIKEETSKPICIITYNEIQARKIISDLKNFTDNFIFFPKKEIVSYDYVSESREIAFARIDVLNQIYDGKCKLIITTIEAIMQNMIPKDALYRNKIRLKVGNTKNLNELKQDLINLGYGRKDIIEARGQFSVRGGIIDVSVQNEKGLRIEFWGDEIDSIRTFNMGSQRSDEMINEITIFPAHEYILDESLIKVSEKIEKNRFNLNVPKGIKLPGDYKKTIDEKIAMDIEKIRQGEYLNKIDKYFNSFYNIQDNFLDYLDDNYIIIIDEKSKVFHREENIKRDSTNLIQNLIDRQRIIPDVVKNLSNFDYDYTTKQTIYLERQDNPEENRDTGLWEYKKEKIVKSANMFNLNFKELTYYRSELDRLLGEIRELVELKKRIIILVGSKIEAEKFSKLLDEREIQSHFEDSLDFKIKKGEVVLTIGALSSGFESNETDLLVISSEEIFGKVNARKKLSPLFKKGEKIVFADLEVGDFVVHKNYGIGQFIGVNTLRADNVTKDYIKIKYKNDDILYIPTNDLDNIRKYSSGGDIELKLNKLGGKEWTKTKARVKRNLQEVAKELIELYAKRKKMKGYMFSKDTEWQKQFEDDFIYQETDDQLRCIQEVKSDMENQKPMDRLLCGDVGYGKTEVAIRAAFKTVMDGKQVAYLVPTTILANQQYEFFKSRMEKYGIKVELLNRFRTEKQKRETLKRMTLGQVDVVVGTHSLLGKNVTFKNLGLLIIDEEHRFGVRDKEKIKQLRSNIDVLSMSATPIPRTMHMSIVGIRDMSVIYEPPNNRLPVQTYVLEYDEEVIREAIVKELERRGQVFYLFNNVENIEQKRNEIKKLVPEAKVSFAHGRMTGREIEDIMERFILKEIDVLVCTTILESGIDIPNANTIIVENADRLGLAQLYQIRGRVGRSDKQAYAYVTYKRDKMITEVAEKRLKAIKEFTEFGSGYKIAMRDLEIRGAGSLLGEIQSGHMEEVGYDTYCELLDEVIKEMQGIEIEPEKEIQIDLNVSSYIPDSYISNSGQKIEMYQNIALCKNEDDIKNVIDEMIDRYGKIPEEAENLIEIARIKQLGKNANILRIIQKRNNINFYMLKENFKAEFIEKLLKKYRNNISFINEEPARIVYKIESAKDRCVVKDIKDFLKELQ
ncbi:MAG: transcription-repair coupling factor [Clostridia bacterium]|nr:transcription-repair coupling factor [Clostridia bacterium]